MNFKQEIDTVRKEKLGLTEVNTNMVFDPIFKIYKEKIIEMPRKTIGYTISIALSNMNNYNRLGNLDELYQKWGDNYYVDLENSSFLEMEVVDNGSIETMDDFGFAKIKELENISNISFSLKELINYCKDKGVRIEIISNEKHNDPSVIEITPYEMFNDNENSVLIYLNSMKN